MILRLTYLASAITLAAASKSGKGGVPEPTPGKSIPAPTFPDSMSYSMSMPTHSPSAGSKSGKGNTPGSKSGKGKTSDEYFIAPFSCPRSCVSAEPYELDSHLLVDGAVTECDAGDSYQKWKVHEVVGGLLKFESAAQYDQGMCLAVVHQDPDHETNTLQWQWDGSVANSGASGLGVIGDGFTPFDWLAFDNHGDYSYAQEQSGGSRRRRNLVSEEDVEGMCTGKLGLAHCDHPGSYWYNTGGNLLSALCWDQGTSTAMSVDGCTDLVAANTTDSGDLTTSETFMLLGAN